MRIGMTLPTMMPDLGRDLVHTWCRRIDGGPFASLAVGERIAFPNQEALVALAAAAAWTERVRIVSTVFVLPMHATAWIAKQVATLDVLSGGRFTLGVGVGGREEDYRAVGAPFARRHARMDEQVAALRRIWSGEPAVEGTAAVGPAPAQAGGPPLWIAASGHRPIERGARWADGLAGFSLGPDRQEVEQVFRWADEAWARAGRPPPHKVMSFWYALGADPRAQLDAYVFRYLRVFGDAAARALRTRCHAAGREALADAVAHLRDLGADEVILVPTTADPAEIDRTLDVLAAQGL